jgi:outer membrane protein assembly factor BamB
MRSSQNPPQHFSVRSGENIAWKLTLPEAGQSGLCIWGDKIFLTCLKPVSDAKPASLMVKDILALCVDRKSGRILWQRDIPGQLAGEAMSGFSDPSSPTPVCDGQRVIFTNAAGRVAAFDFKGAALWAFDFQPVERLDGVHFPFNKQVEPMLSEGLFVHLEPDWKGEAGPSGWNRLVAYDAASGERRWLSQDALTHYNCPQLGRGPDGKPAILIGRGGHHGVPEKPVGYSLIRLADGKRLWAWPAKTGNALYNSSMGSETAFWFSETGTVQALDAGTGGESRLYPLTDKVELRLWDAATGRYGHEQGVDLKSRNLTVFPAWYSNIVVGDKIFFLCFKPGRFRQGIGPDYCVARLDLASGRVEYLELPTAVDTSLGSPVYRWRSEAKSDTRNSRGIDAAHDKRSKRDGWHWNFNGNPIAVNQRVYFTLMNGLVYCLATDTSDFDASALLGVSDLGAAEGCWSLNTPSFAEGALYHRTATELIAIEKR